MILDENHSGFTKKHKDLYTSHEIVQLLPIFNKEKAYEKFIENNRWIKNFTPNFTITRPMMSYKNSFFEKLIIQTFRLLQFEKIAKLLQLSYMKNHKTNEITEDGFLKFHPYNYKNHVLRTYKRKTAQYDL